MMRRLHSVGLTGLVDAGGFGMDPRRYDAVFRLWRRAELTMRLRLFMSATDAGHEIEQLRGWLAYSQPGFGDDMVRVLGIGEVVHLGCHDFEGLEPFVVSPEAAEEFETISGETARRGWPMQVHAVLDATIDVILDAWERVDAEYPLADLRFTLAHADCISRRNIARLRAMGVGVVLDDHLTFRARAAEQIWGEDRVRNAPPIADLQTAGITIAAGTDATRASSFSPWLALWWLVTGRSVDGERHRSPEHTLSREDALVAYTAGSAWMSFEEADRGHLWPGAHADLAVLDRDFFAVPEDDIPDISADLTMVGGRIVSSNGMLAPPTGRILPD
jgi:predicted amidohydrolase YtcJ